MAKYLTLLVAAAALAAAAEPPPPPPPRLPVTGTHRVSSVRPDITNLPTDSRVYDDIDLLKTSGFIRSMPSTSRPWTRGEAAGYVAEAESVALARSQVPPTPATEAEVTALLARSHALGPAQRAALARLQAEFADEIITYWPERPRPRKPVAQVLVPEPGRNFARFDLFSREFVSKDRQSASIGTVLDNRPAENFAFYDRIEMTLFRPKITWVYDSAGLHLPGKRVEPWRDVLTFDMEHAYMAFKIPWMRLEFGRDEFVWGPAHTGSVMLDDSAPSLDHIQFCASYPNFKFTSFTAYLSRWGLKPRFLSAQRLEVSLWHRVTLGGAMMVVTSWDSIQPWELAGVMNPLLPIYFTTATLGHGDNFLIGWDAQVYLPRSRVYTQLFLDNYEFNSLHGAPDALGFQAGGYSAPDLPLEFRAEYTAITPFTYYHRVHSIMYENWQVPLGHPLGPDADQVFASVRYTPGERLRATLAADYTRRGFYNRGGFERKSFYQGESLPVGFPSRGINVEGDTLGPDWAVEQTATIRPSAEVFLGRDLWLVAEAGIWFSRNYQGLPDVDRNGVDFDLKVEYRY